MKINKNARKAVLPRAWQIATAGVMLCIHYSGLAEQGLEQGPPTLQAGRSVQEASKTNTVAASQSEKAARTEFKPDPGVGKLGMFSNGLLKTVRLPVSTGRTSSKELCEGTLLCSGLFVSKTQTSAIINDTIFTVNESAYIRLGIRTGSETNWVLSLAKFLAVSNNVVVVELNELGLIRPIRIGERTPVTRMR